MEPIDEPAGLDLRPLSVCDAEAGENLSAEAGWNQNTADWTYLLTNGLGWGYVDNRDHLGATAMILPYDDRLAWICMVLVTAPWRKRGLATALLRRCIAEAEDRSWTPGLDATDAGRQVYLPLGFRDSFSLTRFKAEPALLSGSSELEIPCRPMTRSDLEAVCELDSAIAGTNRLSLVGNLYERRPDLAWVAADKGNLLGFCLGRDGRDADQIGPIVAPGRGMAITLVTHALNTRADPARRVYIDAVSDRQPFCAWLSQNGFFPQRSFMRMLKGRERPPGQDSALAAIAGPEVS